MMKWLSRFIIYMEIAPLSTQQQNTLMPFAVKYKWMVVFFFTLRGRMYWCQLAKCQTIKLNAVCSRQQLVYNKIFVSKLKTGTHTHTTNNIHYIISFDLIFRRKLIWCFACILLLWRLIFLYTFQEVNCRLNDCLSCSINALNVEMLMIIIFQRFLTENCQNCFIKSVDFH